MTPLSGLPSQFTVSQIGKVSTRAMARKIHEARNLPRIACHGVTGNVSSSSIVPIRRSSDHSRMPTAGTRNRKSHGMPHEECAQGRLAPVEEGAEREGEEAREQEIDDDEDVGDRRSEVAGELAFGDRPDVGPGAGHGRPSLAVSGRVSDRNTSSSRPSSVWSCSIVQRSFSIASATCAAKAPSAFA